LAADSAVYCWGRNDYGQLGDNTTAKGNTPVKVLKGAYSGTTYLGDNSSNKITAVALGMYHSIALAADNMVYSWGRNNYGQLGDNTITGHFTPIKVNGVGGTGDLSLPVELSSFTAAAGDGQVALRWVTESEIANLGFHIYRSLAEEGGYDRITAELIEGAGTASGQNTYAFTDPNVRNGVTYWYKLEDVAFDGRTARHEPISVTPRARILDTEQRYLPDRYELSANVPNPFNPRTEVSYQLPEASEVRLTIYNTAGQRVRRLVEEGKEAGSYRVVWDGLDESGRRTATGVYLYELKAGDFVQVRKMALIR
jgi:hypothetical protein